MRVHRATQNILPMQSAVDDCYFERHEGYPSVVYFRSHAEARRWCNQIIREFVADQRKGDKYFSLKDVAWGAKVEITGCDLASTSKGMFLDLLNRENEGEWFHVQEPVEKWTPQTKWVKRGGDDGLRNRTPADSQ